MKFRQFWLKSFRSQMAKTVQAKAEKHFLKLLGWTDCRMQFWQSAEIFRSKSGSISGLVLKTSPEYILRTRRKQFCQPCRKFLAQVAESLQKGVTQQSSVGPKNKELCYPYQKRHSENSFDKHLEELSLQLRKMFKRLVTQEWSIGQKRLSFDNISNIHGSKSESIALRFRKKSSQSDNLDRQEAILTTLPFFFSTNSQKCSKNHFWTTFRQTSGKDFWQTCSKLLARNPKVFCEKSKTFFQKVHLDTFNAVLKTLGKPSTQS